MRKQYNNLENKPQDTQNLNNQFSYSSQSFTFNQTHLLVLRVQKQKLLKKCIKLEIYFICTLNFSIRFLLLEFFGMFSNLQCWNQLQFKNRIEIMSKTTFSFDTDLKTTTLSKAENKSRLLKIQQKLQAITLQRQTHAKEQLQEQLTRRITDLQLDSAEEIKQMESKVRMLREELGQAKLKESQFIKKLQLARKTRSIEIAEIQKKLASLSSFQSKDRKDIESALTRSIELKTDGLLKDLKQAKQERIQRINELQERLQTQLPQAHLEIQEGCAEIQEQLEQVHRKVKQEVEDLREQVQKNQSDREKTVKSIMQMINNAVQEIKADLEKQKIARNKSKQQLLALFNSAYGKLNPHQ